MDTKSDQKDLLSFQQRIVSEKQELDKKISDLDNFIEHNELFKRLPISEQVRMIDQGVAMDTYSKILGERIAEF